MTAAGIATLAFGEFVKAGVGEIAKKSIEGAVAPLQALIKKRFAGNQKAETAIEKIEKEGSPEALNKLSVYLDDEMDDVTFAQSLQQLANQITNVQNNVDHQYNNYGRDQITIENITGNPKIGGS
jgi:predicted ATP-dependent Lon-type protease